MDRLNAALTGRYAIEREIGAGGMATVYLAEDLRHHRKVAVKVLRPELAVTLGSGRFLHEIEIAAQLQHPNILPLLDSGEAAGFVFYVMPFVDGPSLRQRLVNQGELPVHDAVKILLEIVDALAEAHGKGIVHRDMKPDNVLLTGRHAVITDFGVAKAVGEATGRHALTTAGVALGTPTYMAPEQAAADPTIDHRVDIYAVGVMAYEMLTGRPPFTGASQQAIISAQITEQPVAVTQHRPSVPPVLEQVVMRCLAKHPADRWQSASELFTQLESLATPTGGVTPTDTRPVRAASLVPWWKRRSAVAVAGGVAGALLLLTLAITSTPGVAPISFGQTRQVTLDPGLELDPALSPDGRLLAYAGSAGGGAINVFVRPVGGGSPVNVTRELPGFHRMPRWSPDGSQILFSSDGRLFVVPPLGGSPRVVAQGAAYGTWAPDGRRIAYVRFVDAAISELLVRGIEGGEPKKLTEGNDIHSPAWSPDGALIAYVVGNSLYAYSTTILGNLGPSALNVVPADGGEPAEIASRQFLNMSPTWMADSRTLLMVSTREGGRDVYRVRLDGKGRPVGDMARVTTGLSAGTIALSPDGRHMAYSVFANPANIWAVRIPANGAISVREAEPVTAGSQHIEGVAISPDGRWIAFDSDRGGNADIYKMPVGGGEPVQLTRDQRDDFIPAWSPDGAWIAFQSWRYGNRDLFVISADGAAEQQVTSGPKHEMYANWSPDGRRIVFYSNLTGSNEVYVSDRQADGRWAEPRQLTRGGGISPQWSHDGRTILFLGLEGAYTMDATGGVGRHLLSNPFEQGGTRHGFGSVIWSRDGRSIYVKTSEGIWAMPAAGGAPRLLVRFDDATRPSGRQEFATDGKRLYFTVDNRLSDIWVTEVRTGR